MVMDVLEDYILVTYRPFDVHIFHVKILGELSPSAAPVLQVRGIILGCIYFIILVGLVFKIGFIDLLSSNIVTYNLKEKALLVMFIHSVHL